MAASYRLIEENSLQATESGYDVQMRLNWYRSLPFSCLEKVELVLNGELVDPEKISIRIDNQKYAISDLADLVEEYWFVQDPATVSVDQPGKVKPDEKYEIEMTVAVRAPYIPTGPNQYLTTTTIDKFTQMAR